MLPRDSERPPYRTGDEAITGLVSFLVTMPAVLWYQGAWMDSQLSMTNADNWQQSGTVSIEDAVQAAGMSYREITTMLGTIFLWAGVTDPQFEALPCDGSEYDRADYPALYDLLAAFHTGPDTFTTPDLRGRAPIGTGSGYGIGDTGGEADHVLTVGELASHTHGTGNSFTGLALAPGEEPVLIPNPLPAITGYTGDNDPHNNMPPYMALEFWIMAV